MTWYDNLEKSSLTPPSAVFGVVWPFLYALMALSLIRFVGKGPTAIGLVAFAVQFLLNLAWTPLFFTHRRICVTAVVVVLMTAATIVAAFDFYMVDPVSAYLLLPYIAWNLFALYLNTFICLANASTTTT